ncbi:MAG TPA: adenosine kinase [Steroidobacteraceae bacterium]
MSTTQFDVVGIGNAIVDVVAMTTSAFLEEHELTKGAMLLVDEATAARIYGAMGQGIETSGGSAANTIAGLASLGARCGFIGKTCDDQLGEVFRHDLRALGIHFPTTPLRGAPSTARCLVLVTPDAHRTMATFLGAATQLTPDDVDAATIRSAAITYLEGYLFDPPLAKAAFRRARELAHAAGKRVALTLSDAFCVERHRDDFLALLRSGVDVLFANEREIMKLLGSDQAAVIRARLSSDVAITVITRSERGSLVLTAGETHEIASVPLAPVLDTTGAGDLYASGFLYGLATGFDLARCGKLASLCAAEAISHFGARPQSSLRALAATYAIGA